MLIFWPGAQPVFAKAPLRRYIPRTVFLMEGSTFRNRLDSLPALLLLAVTAVVFWPATRWTAEQTLAYEQVRQSFFLLLFAAAILWIDHRGGLRPVFEVSPRGLQLLGSAHLLLALTVLVAPIPLIALISLALALAGFVHIVFGDKGLRVSLPWLAAFGTFLGFILIFPILDWPLRRIAGVQSAQLIELLGYHVDLSVTMRDGVRLFMDVDGRIYEVATECNGFGLMSSSVLLALLLILGRPIGPGWKAAAVLLALAVGLGFNILRIIGIVVMAPYFPDHYNFMHEVIGIAALFGGLAFLWWLLGGIRRTEAPPAQSDDAARSAVSKTTP